MSNVTDIRVYKQRKHLENALESNIEIRKTLTSIYKQLKPYVEYRAVYDLVGNLMESREKVKRDIAYLQERIKQLDNMHLHNKKEKDV